MLLRGKQDFAARGHDSFDANRLVMVTLRQATSEGGCPSLALAQPCSGCPILRVLFAKGGWQSDSTMRPAPSHQNTSPEEENISPGGASQLSAALQRGDRVERRPKSRRDGRSWF